MDDMQKTLGERKSDLIMGMIPTNTTGGKTILTVSVVLAAITIVNLILKATIDFDIFDALFGFFKSGKSNTTL